jgi:ribokinase
VIVVLGRPGLGNAGADAAVDAGAAPELDGRAAAIARAARRAGADVELVGSVGDDPEGDLVMVALGRADIGHAAVLRDPTARTPTAHAADISASTRAPGAPLPRLDPGDVSLGLSYVSECRVLVIAEPLSAAANGVAAEAAAYHGAAIVAVAEEGSDLEAGLPETATIFEAAAGDQEAFADLVGQYAAAIAEGVAPSDAFRRAREAAGWETVRP